MNKSALKKLISIFGAGVIISASLMATGLVGVKSYADAMLLLQEQMRMNSEKKLALLQLV